MKKAVKDILLLIVIIIVIMIISLIVKTNNIYHQMSSQPYYERIVRGLIAYDVPDSMVT